MQLYYAIIVCLIIVLYLYQNKYEHFNSIKYLSADARNRLYEYLPIEYYYTDESYLTELINLARTVISILNNNNIKYWLIFGSLLGCIRHNGIIPWDDDIDLAFDVGDLQKIYGLKKEFLKHGLKLSKYQTSKRELYKIKYINPNNNNRRKAWIDLFAYRMDKNDVWHRTLGSYVQIKNKDLFPLKTKIFHGINANVPNNYNNILEQQYGSDWNTHAVLSLYKRLYNKHREQNVHTKKIKLRNKFKW